MVEGSVPLQDRSDAMDYKERAGEGTNIELTRDRNSSPNNYRQGRERIGVVCEGVRNPAGLRMVVVGGRDGVAESSAESPSSRRGTPRSLVFSLRLNSESSSTKERSRRIRFHHASDRTD